MSTAATLKATVNFSDGAVFAPTLSLGDPTTPLGYGALGETSTLIVDVTADVLRCNIRRTYSRITDTWNPGTANVIIVDTNGDWNPDNTASPYYGLIKPMRKIQLSGVYAGTEYALFSGFIQSWTYTAPNGVDLGKMEMRCYDAFLLLNNAQILTVTGATAGQTTGTRITKILDEISWNTGQRAIDTGATLCQADPGTQRTVLNALQTVEETEFGALYIDWLGRVTFKDRASLVAANAETPTTFSDNGVGITYQNVDFGLDDTLITNYASVQPAGLTPQVHYDTVSMDTYFTHSNIRTDLLMTTEADALQQARAIVAARAYDELRIDSIDLDISDDAEVARVIAALELDFLDNIQVIRTAPGGAIDKTLLIHGVTHDVTPNRWITTFQTVEPVITGFVLSSTTSGVLGEDSFSY